MTDYFKGRWVSLSESARQGTAVQPATYTQACTHTHTFILRSTYRQMTPLPPLSLSLSLEVDWKERVKRLNEHVTRLTDSPGCSRSSRWRSERFQDEGVKQTSDWRGEVSVRFPFFASSPESCNEASGKDAESLFTQLKEPFSGLFDSWPSFSVGVGKSSPRNKFLLELMSRQKKTPAAEHAAHYCGRKVVLIWYFGVGMNIKE